MKKRKHMWLLRQDSFRRIFLRCLSWLILISLVVDFFFTFSKNWNTCNSTQTGAPCSKCKQNSSKIFGQVVFFALGFGYANINCFS